MDLETFRKNIENKGVKTGKIVFLSDGAILPIQEEKDLRSLVPVIYEFESKTDFKVEVVMQPSETAFESLEKNKFFLSERDYAQEKLVLMKNKQDFDVLTLKTSTHNPVFFKLTKK